MEVVVWGRVLLSELLVGSGCLYFHIDFMVDTLRTIITISFFKVRNSKLMYLFVLIPVREFSQRFVEIHFPLLHLFYFRELVTESSDLVDILP